MGDLFGIANLISSVGVDGVKIKQEPGLPEKSSNEILTELFSTFDVDGNTSLLNQSDEHDDGDDDDDDDGSDRIKKKKKKSKKKSKHKEKKHKKKSKKNSSDDSDVEHDGSKRKKKKKIKRRRGSNSSESSNSNEPKVKIKKEKELSPDFLSSIYRNSDEKEMKTVFDLVQSVMTKKEPVDDVDNIGKKSIKEKSPELPLICKKPSQDDFVETTAPRLLEKNDQVGKGKILIKDLKNSSVYNEALKEVENKKKEKEEKAARMEDGEISDSNSDDRTPTLSPSPSFDGFDLSDNLLDVKSNLRDKKDLRLVLKQKEKNKKSEIKDLSRSKTEERSGKDSNRSSRSKDERSRSDHSRGRKELDSLNRRRSRGRDNRRTISNDRKNNRERSSERKSFRSRERSRYNDQRCRSEDRHRFRTRTRSRSRGRTRMRHRSRSRSNERKERIEIDKKKLLEIARKNAINMIKKGTLPLAQQDKAIAAIQAGGKTVDELIDFCKSLSKSEALGELSSVSSDDGDSGSERGFHHPFLLKERPNSIVMNIRDSKPIPTKTFQERTTESSNQLRLQFPVSSGQQHRKSENEWIDVTPPPPLPKKVEPKKTFVQSATTLQPLAFTIKPPLNAIAQATPTSLIAVPEPVPSPVPPVLVPQPQILPTDPPNPLESIPSQTPAESDSPQPTVFPPPPAESVDIGVIVSQRLAAMRKLRENPHDVEALNEMYHAQNEMRTWAESKQMPGQFTGSTGAKVLSPAELTSGYQAWARKDQLTSAQPVSGGMGMALLQKMGWRPGEGLGKNKEGTLEPLQLEVKLDKRGLVSEQDVGVKMGKVPGKPIVPTIKTLEGKHPVSLLGEYCSKKKYGAPVYELCFECGPDHKKNFLFKVKVNGIEYKPSVASPNKKQAKAEAAQICLQTLGLLPS